MATRRKKRRTAAQRRATNRMIAANRRRRNPNNRRNNNNRRNYNRKRRAMRTYVANPRHRRRVRRRNPNGGRITMRNVMNRHVMPAFQGALGGIGLDILWGYLPVPATPGMMNLKAGPLRHVAKGAGAIVMGMLAGQFVRQSTANQMTTGALTTVLYTAIREQVSANFPAIPLGAYMEGMGYYSAGEVASPQYNNMGQVPYGSPLTPMGEYMGPDDNNLGYYETGVEGDLMGMGMGVYE